MPDGHADANDDRDGEGDQRIAQRVQPVAQVQVVISEQFREDQGHRRQDDLLDVEQHHAALPDGKDAKDGPDLRGHMAEGVLHGSGLSAAVIIKHGAKVAGDAPELGFFPYFQRPGAREPGSR